MDIRLQRDILLMRYNLYDTSRNDLRYKVKAFDSIQ